MSDRTSLGDHEQLAAYRIQNEEGNRDGRGSDEWVAPVTNDQARMLATLAAASRPNGDAR